MSVIEIKNLTRDYGRGKGVFDLSFSVNEGEVFGFLGPNGAGKTTTIRHLLGFIRNKTGYCTINGLDCWSDSSEIQQSLGYIPGEISFFEDMTGTDFLNFVSKYKGITDPERRKELIERFELDPNGKIKKMSKGMKQKIGIVSAFMHSPRILILDEPTSGLDPIMQNRFIELLKEEKSRGTTVLLSSHIFEEVERTCDRIGIIKDGRLAAVDSVETLRERHTHTYTVALKTPQEASAFAKDFCGTASGVNVTVLSKQSLETIFLNYYGGGEK